MTSRKMLQQKSKRKNDENVSEERENIMRKRNIALILAASMMATFAFGGTTAFAAEEGKTDSVTVGIMADPENMGPWSGMVYGSYCCSFYYL